MTVRKNILWVILLSAARTYSASAAEHYSVTDLGTMGLDMSYPTGINSGGGVVGFAVTNRSFGQGEMRPFIYSHGVMRDLHDALAKAMPKRCSFRSTLVITEADDVLGALSCGVRGIYPEGTTFLYRDGTVSFMRGNVAAVSSTGVFLLNLCRWSSTLSRGCHGCEVRRVTIDVHGSEHELGPLEGVHDAARINSAEEIVGWTCEFSGGISTRHVWLWRKGLRQDLGFSYGSLGINDQGQIVGEAGGSDKHASLYSDGKLQDLGTLGGGGRSTARAINHSGQIVGYSDTRTRYTHAFLWEKGVMKDLNQLSVGPLAQFVTLISAEGINDAGTIIATGNDSRRAGFYVGPSAYLLSPVARDP